MPERVSRKCLSLEQLQNNLATASEQQRNIAEHGGTALGMKYETATERCSASVTKDHRLRRSSFA